MEVSEEQLRKMIREEMSKRPTNCPSCGHGLVPKTGMSGVKCPECNWFKCDN